MQAYENKWAVMPEWNAAPSIDGVLDEPKWQSAAELSGFVNAYNKNSASGNPAYKLAYDEANLYVGGTVALQGLDDLARIEIAISPRSSGNLYYTASIPVRPSRPMTTAWHDSADGPDAPVRIMLDALEYDTTEDAAANRFTIELAIPLSSFEGVSAVAGDEWRINVMHVHNVNTKPLASWLPIRTSFFMDRYGTTVSYVANVVDQSRLGSVFFKHASGEPWAPEEWELGYTGFAGKRLAFAQTSPARNEFRLEWKAPGQDWRMLTEVNASTAGTRVVLDFEHPEPLQNGAYQLRLTACTAAPCGEELHAIWTFDREDLIAAGLAEAQQTQPPASTTPVVPAPASPQVQAAMALIPAQNGFRFTGLPEMPELAPDMLYTLSGDGRHLVSSKTGTIYPNSQYPETGSLTATDRNGQTVTYPYYEDAQGKRYFFSAHLWHLQKARAIAQTESIAATDPLGAARLLYRFAEASERYVPTTDDRWYNRPMNATSGPPHNYWGGTWDRFYLYELNALRPLLRAYAVVKQTDALQVLSEEAGIDVNRKLVEEMFIPAADYLNGYSVRLANLDYSAWLGLIELGKALGEPDYIHRAVEWMEEYAERRYLSDGSWFEVTPSYHNQATIGLIEAIEALQGYSDPAGYVSPRTGRRFDQLDLYRDYPLLAKSKAFTAKLAYPNRKTVPVQDTWAADGAPSAPPGSGAQLLPASGIGRLALGEDAEQAQLYMQFVPKYGHDHYDPLSLNLYAEGQELLPDIGYTYSRYRYFSTSTIGHNTVVVDGKNMSVSEESRHGGRIERFISDGGSFQAMRASQKEAYPQTDEYSREPWFISFPEGNGKGYILDLFRVAGGNRHEYTLQGDANRDAYLMTGMQLDEYGPRLLPPGTEAHEATAFSESGTAEGHYPGYIYIKDVKRAELGTADRYETTMATFENGTGKADLHITGLLESGNNELFIARSPSLRSTRLFGKARDTNDEAVKYDMPKLVLRRDGAGVASTFVTVMEPSGSLASKRIEAIDRLQPDSAPAGAVAVQIAYGDTTDIVLSSPRHPEQELVVGDIAMKGEMGFIRLVDGAVTEMTLVGGTLLQKGGVALEGSGTVTGTVYGTMRTLNGDAYDALVTTAPVNAAAVGRYAVVTHPDETTRGFEIAGIETMADGKTAIVLGQEDPGFAINGDGTSELKFYPFKQWTGAHTFDIALVDRMEGTADPEPPQTGTVTGVVYDVYGQTVAGAHVNLTGYASVASQTDGSGRFALPDAPAGTRRMTVVSAVYGLTVSEPFSVEPGGTTAIGITAIDRLAPVVTGPGSGMSGVGDPVQAVSTEDGVAFLVPDKTAPLRESIESAASAVPGMRQPVLAGIPAEWDTTGMAPGRYSLYAIDTAGNVSAGVPLRLIARQVPRIEDDSGNVTYSGQWLTYEAAQDSGGTHTVARSAQASADFAFYGKRAKLYGVKSSNFGHADIWVDGVHKSTVNGYSASVQYGQLLHDTGELENGAHSIRVVASWTKDETSSNYYIGLDALEITLEELELPVLSDLPTGAVGIGDPVTAVSSKNGTIYLVPIGTNEERSAVEAAGSSANGRTATVTANVYGVLDTTGLNPGRYRLHAIDTHGNLSAGSASVAVIPKTSAVVEDSDPLIAYTGSWQRYDQPASRGGSHTIAKGNGAAAEIPFYGSGATLLGVRSTNFGRAAIEVDGVYRTTIDGYSAGTLFQQALFDTGPLAPGAHIVTIRPLWTKAPASSNYYVGIDALLVEDDTEL